MTPGTDEEILDPNIRAQLGKVREHEQAAQAATARAEAAERELAFAKAGVPDDAGGQIFRRGYDGDLTTDAIKESYEEAFVGRTQEPPPVSEAELAQQRQIAAAGAGSTPAAGTIRYEDAINSARNEAEVMALIDTAPDGATDRNGYKIVSPSVD
jgi:hypothetical protein